MATYAFARVAGRCICGKEMYDRHFGTCVWCGHGNASDFVDNAYRRNMERNAGPIMRTTPAYDARVVPLRRRGAWTEDECAAAFIAWKANHGREPKSTDWAEPMATGDKRPSYGTINKLFGGWQGFLDHIADIPKDQFPKAVHP